MNIKGKNVIVQSNNLWILIKKVKGEWGKYDFLKINLKLR